MHLLVKELCVFYEVCKNIFLHYSARYSDKIGHTSVISWKNDSISFLYFHIKPQYADRIDTNIQYGILKDDRRFYFSIKFLITELKAEKNHVSKGDLNFSNYILNNNYLITTFSTGDYMLNKFFCIRNKVCLIEKQNTSLYIRLWVPDDVNLLQTLLHLTN